jgi:hypothetical protein
VSDSVYLIHSLSQTQALAVSFSLSLFVSHTNTLKVLSKHLRTLYLLHPLSISFFEFKSFFFTRTHNVLPSLSPTLSPSYLLSISYSLSYFFHNTHFLYCLSIFHIHDTNLHTLFPLSNTHTHTLFLSLSFRSTHNTLSQFLTYMLFLYTHTHSLSHLSLSHTHTHTRTHTYTHTHTLSPLSLSLSHTHTHIHNFTINY